jgi:hypothetical protein
MHAPIGVYGHTVGSFSPEQATAINNNVDLRLYFGVHGAFATPTRVVHVAETDYVAMKSIVDDMSPGGIFASELFPVPKQDAHSHIQELVNGLPSANPKLREAEGDTEQILELARKHRAIGPFMYAMGHASLKGLKVSYADMPREGIFGFKDGLAKQHKMILPRVLCERRLRLHERDFWTVQTIGDISLGIDRQESSTSRPLALLRGMYHQEKIESILGSQGINFTSTTITRPPGTRFRLATSRGYRD